MCDQVLPGVLGVGQHQVRLPYGPWHHAHEESVQAGVGMLGEQVEAQVVYGDCRAASAQPRRQRRHHEIRGLVGLGFGQEQDAVFGHFGVQRRAQLFPVGEQFGQRARVQHRGQPFRHRDAQCPHVWPAA
ncbi:MAG: hypothetical protein C4345_14520 [Chloroflexota bacterium]